MGTVQTGCRNEQRAGPKGEPQERLIIGSRNGKRFWSLLV